MAIAKEVTINEKAAPEVKKAYHRREITQGQAFEYAQHAPEKSSPPPTPTATGQPSLGR